MLKIPLLHAVTLAIAPTEVLTTYQALKNHFDLKYSEEDYDPDTYRYFGEVFAMCWLFAPIFQNTRKLC